ncbi:arginase family protein [Spiractinospora alimapuensis]|uniref:arginase family protein n=1 Tax=Spiractinospora alimapuensis TaxID=2820884 RepID=UPI001F234E6E|nr:arginase family protein [Spiractinospora alimapuensis]QVQ54322.1 arginase family protein [Spiractinospora alimapuensis]
MVALHEVVAQHVAAIVGRGEQVVVASGDCMVALGVAAGLQRAGVEPGIVWLDAHGDLQTLETTPSGYLGGMPLSVLLGYRPELWGRPMGLRPFLEDDILLVGARDLDPSEAEYLRTSRIRRAAVEDPVADHIASRPHLVHLDTDVVDPAELTGQLFPTANGAGKERVRQTVADVIGRASSVPALSVGLTSAPERVATDPWYRHLLTGLMER